MQSRKIDVKVNVQRMNMFFGTAPALEPAIETNNKKSGKLEFIYDRKTILELGEMLAELALNTAKQQLQAAKSGKRVRKVS